VRANREKPFLLHLAHTMVHSVVGASPEFRGKSQDGLYGDAVEEIDFHTGRLLDTLDEPRLSETRLVIFTTDNGPWSNNQENLRRRHNGEIAWGSSGPLREAIGSTYEGGSARAVHRALARQSARRSGEPRDFRHDRFPADLRKTRRLRDTARSNYRWRG
jgi:hypothetical protein